MPIALPALELVPLLAALLYLAFLAAVSVLVYAIYQALRGPLGHIPFVGGWLDSAYHYVQQKVNGAVTSTRHLVTVLWQGFLWSVQETVAVLDYAAVETYSTLSHFATSAIPGAFESLFADALYLHGVAMAEAAKAEALAWSNLARAEHYANGAAAAAVATAARYTDAAAANVHRYASSRVDAAVATLEADVASAKAAAVATAEHYTDAVRLAIEHELSSSIAGVESDLGAAVSRLNASIASAQSALETELSAEAATLSTSIASTASELESKLAAAEKLALEGIAAVQASGSAALHAAVGELEQSIAGVRAATTAIAAELAAVEGGAAAELGSIYGLGSDDLRHLLDRLDLSKLAELGVGVVLIRALVDAMATETGLSRAECRAKVRGICGTDPARWSRLLAGLVAIGVAFDFRELVAFAETLVTPAVDVLRKVA